MNILVLNCGSSSLKYRLISLPAERELAGGEAQRVGPPTAKPSCIYHRVNGREQIVDVPMPDHATALQHVTALLARDERLAVDAVGHRYVHGGSTFSEPVVVDDAVEAALEKTRDLAPIHNPPSLGLLKVCRSRYPTLPQVVVFDTGYHATIPDYARYYALPWLLATRHDIRKYGFHGTSHQYVVEEAARFLRLPLDRFSAVSCHLGSGGASLCAVVNGRSVDNTMGFSPLQGLVMSTRCGDLDPVVPLAMMRRQPGAWDAIEKTLNNKSGVLGLSGRSADIRDILGRTGDPEGIFPAGTDGHAAAVYLWRLRKYLGSYLAVVGRPQAVIFTDTIGETMPCVRWAVCSGLERLGIQIDAARNRAATRLPADVATTDSPVRVLVVQTNEELAIARRTYEAVKAGVATHVPASPRHDWSPDSEVHGIRAAEPLV